MCVDGEGGTTAYTSWRINFLSRPKVKTVPLSFQHTEQNKSTALVAQHCSNRVCDRGDGNIQMQ
jgi:hypothetical protein